jgi:hypothetical protein
MTHQICYWDEKLQMQCVRDSTPAEDWQRDIDIVAADSSIERHNAPILAALDALDAKSIRPLREGDAVRVAALEQQAAELRAQLRKD